MNKNTTKKLKNFPVCRSFSAGKQFSISFIFFLFALMPHFSFGQTCGESTTIGTGLHTWVAPADITSSVTIQVWGAGGGGGTEFNVSLKNGGGGGGGAYSSSTLTVTPSTTYSLTVGAGGTAAPKGATSGPPTKYDGGNGGDSWFGNATTVMAKGGNFGVHGAGAGAGAGGAGGQSASGFGTTIYSGGNGSAGNVGNSGSGGS